MIRARGGGVPNSSTLFRSYEICADYHQFYLADAEKFEFAPEDYTDEDVKRRIKNGRYVVVVQPERNMTVPVELEILMSPPNDDFSGWQHVAEASLDLPSGKLRIEECTGDVKDEITLDPNSYRVRVYYAGLDTLSFDGLDGDDHYRIVIWPAPVSDVKVLKQYSESRET